MSEPIHKQAQAVVAQWNRDVATARERDQQCQANPTSITPGGRFGMDGYFVCGAVCGGLYGGLAGG